MYSPNHSPARPTGLNSLTLYCGRGYLSRKAIAIDCEQAMPVFCHADNLAGNDMR